MVIMNTKNNTNKQDTAEDPLSFLNSLPEVKKKPEPEEKPDVFAEHLAFLDSLKSTQPDESTTQNQNNESEKLASKKTSPAPKPKKKTNTQLQREEKNRLEATIDSTSNRKPIFCYRSKQNWHRL